MKDPGARMRVRMLKGDISAERVSVYADTCIVRQTRCARQKWKTGESGLQCKAALDAAYNPIVRGTHDPVRLHRRVSVDRETRGKHSPRKHRKVQPTDPLRMQGIGRGNDKPGGGTC